MHDDVAQRTEPALWQRVKARVMRGAKGGKPGTWSARKAQLAVAEYKRAGGGYRGGKSPRNSLARWTREAWDTPSGRDSRKTGERTLPKAARERLSASELARTSARKRADARAGQRVSRQPADIARKAEAARKATPSRKTRSRTAPAKPAAAPKTTRRPPARRAAARKQAAR